MTIHLPPLFTIIGVVACVAFLSYIVFMLFMVWGFSNDWGPRLALPATVFTASVSWYFLWRIA